jgi:dihydrofolate reductase
MGRVLYQDMEPYWPESTDVQAPPMNEIPKAVFSNTLTEAPWADGNILSGDLAEEIGKLKDASEKGILLHGGASFARELSDLGLIDEYVLIQHPVAIGEGLPIFGEQTGLELTDSVVFPKGAVALTFRRAG